MFFFDYFFEATYLLKLFWYQMKRTNSWTLTQWIDAWILLLIFMWSSSGGNNTILRVHSKFELIRFNFYWKHWNCFQRTKDESSERNHNNLENFKTSVNVIYEHSKIMLQIIIVDLSHSSRAIFESFIRPSINLFFVPSEYYHIEDCRGVRFSE